MPADNASLNEFSGNVPTKTKPIKRAELLKILASGVGFLADAYDLFVIDAVGTIVTKTTVDVPSFDGKSLIATVTLIGAVIGQIGFGIAADFMGRRLMFLCTSFLVIFGSIASALVGFGYHESILSCSIFVQLAICRFFLGVGIGGEYPLAATVSAEAKDVTDSLESDYSDVDDDENKSWFWFLTHPPNSLAAVFTMQGFGMLISSLIVILLILAGVSLHIVWRLCLAFGAIPSSIAFYYRWKMHETACFERTQLAKKKIPEIIELKAEQCNDSIKSSTGVNELSYSMSDDASVAFKDSNSSVVEYDRYTSNYHTNNEVNTHMSSNTSNIVERSRFKNFLATLNEFKIPIIGTSVSWFLIDVVLYGSGSFKNEIFSYIFTKSKPTLELQDMDAVIQALKNETLFGGLVALFALPGYLLSVFFIHKTGLKSLQMFGFVSIAVLFFVMAIQELTLKISLLTVCGLVFSFFLYNFGANTTTFIIPTQVFPTVVRATCHGFSAAVGKAGAAVGTSLVTLLLRNWKLYGLCFVWSFVGIVGALATHFFIPSDREAKKIVQQYSADQKKILNI